MGSTIRGAVSKLRPLRPAVYAPLPTFFDKDENIDFESCKSHLLNLATKAIVPICAGSLGEAVHLDRSERSTLIRFLRTCLNDAGLRDTPIVAGVGAASTRETVQLAQDAATAGADAGMVILPAYYAASLRNDESQIVKYYVDICNNSPIPILLYNFPANSAGLDMSSSTIEAIMRRSNNLAGVKLTYFSPAAPVTIVTTLINCRCGGSIAKLMRLQAVYKSEPQLNSNRTFPFLFLDGLIADLKPWVHCGGHGTVSGMSNFAPLACVRLLELCNKAELSDEEASELDRLQEVLSVADVVAVPAGVRGMKFALHKFKGYGPKPRRPLLELGSEEGEAFMRALAPVLEIEKELRDGFDALGKKRFKRNRSPTPL